MIKGNQNVVDGYSNMCIFEYITGNTMSWLNSVLLALTSVQPYMVPATVIGLVSFAFVCFIIFYLYRSIKIVNRLKNTHCRLIAL